MKTVEAYRSVIPGLDLKFAAPAGRYIFDRDVVEFLGQAGSATVRCGISREALEDHFGADGLEAEGRVEVFLRNRSKIESMARTKYMSWPVEEPETVLLKTADVKKLFRPKAKQKSRPRSSRLSH